jgi:hypothetical protein
MRLSRIASSAQYDRNPNFVMRMPLRAHSSRHIMHVRAIVSLAGWRLQHTGHAVGAGLTGDRVAAPIGGSATRQRVFPRQRAPGGPLVQPRAAREQASSTLEERVRRHEDS